MGFVDVAFRSVFRRTSTFALACVVGAFFFERGLDYGTKTIFYTVNQGKLWKDIKHKYAE